MAENGNEEKPKIIVDDDWKTQAQAEKQQLADEVEKKQAAAGAGGASASERGLPDASFSTLVSSLVTQIFMALGGMEDPQSGRRVVDLDLAKFHIDTLDVLETKTQGQLESEEKDLLDRALYETRMRYVEIAQIVADQQQRQATGETGQGNQGPSIET
jgi:hypothetical protein